MAIPNNLAPYSSLAQIYPPQPEILEGIDKHLVDPLAVTLKGKYLTSSSHEIREKTSICYSRVKSVVARIPCTPITSRSAMLVLLGTYFLSLYSIFATLLQGARLPLWVDVTCFSLLILSGCRIVAYRCLQNGEIEDNPRVVHHLEWLKKNPYFLELWEEINREEKLQFQIISKEEAEEKKDYCANAWYSIRQHTVTFVQGMDDFDFSQALIFECCNAFLRHLTIQLRLKLGWNNIPNRNTYGILREQVEYYSLTPYSQIVKYGIENLNWDERLLCYHDRESKTVVTFQEVCSLSSLPCEEKISHAEGYRMQWDRLYAPTFFLKHSEALEQHPELLKYRSFDNKSLFHLVMIDCVKLFRLSDSKTQEEVLIALMAFIRRWYAQKQKLNIQNNPEDLPDNDILFFGCVDLIAALQKEGSAESFIEKVKTAPTFELNLQNTTKNLLLHFVSFLLVIEQKIREEGDESLGKTILLRNENQEMLRILSRLSILIQQKISAF
jgi:hypothetical protein